MNQNASSNNQKSDYNATHVPNPEVDLGQINFDDGRVEKINHAESGKFSLKFEQRRIESPFLPPEYLQEYERIEKGLGTQLIGVIIEHQKFQMEVKRAEIELLNKNFEESARINAANIREQDSLITARNRELDIKSRGQIFAFLITIILLATAIYFAKNGYLWQSSGCIAIIVAMAVVMFLQRTHNEKAKELESEPNSDENKQE
ncbi:hypothetical protein C9426_00930 [Serratia sp. S1B]|nr:hypothetical protein C9426_00930 [Serratia sp. S1B]